MARLRLGGILIAVAVALTSIIASIVHAGAKMNFAVNITTAALGNGCPVPGMCVSGALGYVRNDSTTDYIGCYASVSAVPLQKGDPTVGGVPMVTCSARVGPPSPTNPPVTCVSIDAGIVRLAQTIGPDSYIRFNIFQLPVGVEDPTGRNGTCSLLEVQNYSHHSPKSFPTP
jgi:hypothetical protein